MVRVMNVAARAVLTGFVLLLAACGGGGGRGSGGPPNPPAPTTFSVGGTVSGLNGNSLALRLNGGADLVVAANGNFTFPGRLASGTAYTVTVQTQPTAPAQTCLLTNATGNIAANVTNVTVACTTNTYPVGGTVTGLAAAGLVLRNNGGDDLAVNADGAFTFGTAIASGANYLVTVFAQPANQHCSVTNGSGPVLAADVTGVAVTCVNTYTIGGTVSGLDVPGLVLRNFGGDDLTVNANGAFTFSARVPLGGAYNVTAVAGTPNAPRHLCQVANSAGLVPNANVADVLVTCEADRFAYVAHYNLNGPFSGSAITAYTQDHETGGLTLIAGTSTFPTGSGATSLASDPRGRFIYVANELADTVSGFSVNPATGALTPVPGSPYAAGVRPRDVAIDSEGKFLYATAWYSSEVYGWAIQADGSLVAVPGSPVSTVSGGTSSGPISIAMSQDQQCCYVYVAHQLASPAELSAFAYDQDTGALTPVAGSPYAMPGLHSPSSVVANITGELVYVTATGSSNVATFDIAGGIGGGVLTPRPGSPTPFTPGPCEIVQPRLSPSIFAASSNAYVIAHWGTDVDTALPTFLGGTSLEAGNYCTVASDPHGRFAYTTNNNADTLFGFSVDQIGGTFTPLPLSPTPPENRLTTPSREPRAMVLRYSRRDREDTQVPE